MKFPVFRKYKNSSAYFKINAPDLFEEISFIKDNGFIYEIKALQYPEKLRIMDMLSCKDDIWVEIEEEEYETKKSLI